MKCTEFLHLPCILTYPNCGLRVPGWGNCRPRGSCCSNTTRCNCTPWLSRWKGLWIAGILFKTKRRSMITVLLTAQDKATQCSRQIKQNSTTGQKLQRIHVYACVLLPSSRAPSPCSWGNHWNWSISGLFWWQVFSRLSLPAPPLVSLCFTQTPCFHEALCWGLSYRILYKPHFSMRELYQLYCTDE